MATIDVPPTATIITRVQPNDNQNNPYMITLPSCLGFGVGTSFSLQPAEPRQRSIPCYCGNSNQSVAIPTGVVVIAARALAYCSPRSLTLPDTLTTIKPSAFTYMSHYVDIGTTVVLPDSVTYIGDSAFEEASYVHIPKLPNSVTYLGGKAFEYSAFGPVLNYSGPLSNISTQAFQAWIFSCPMSPQLITRVLTSCRNIRHSVERTLGKPTRCYQDAQAASGPGR
eukprot:m.340202 g.340202  ORF g.340202 m.340202 type:complete len:225 (+) comp16544_c0_seq2:448-1122(+)